MRYLFIIIGLLISTSSLGQELNSIKTRLNLLKTKIDFKLDSTGISKLTLPSYYCIENKLENSWHVQDLNNDGLNDLIYSGTCQPYSQTAIFLNSQKGYKLVYDYPGKLISIINSSTELKINILKPSCCCDYYSDLIEVLINNKSEIQKNTISFYFETKIKTSNKLYSRTISGVLRGAPTIDDNVKKDVCSDNTIVGNQIEIINNKTAIILNTKKNWSLVLIRKSDSYSILGWINKFKN